MNNRVMLKVQYLPILFSEKETQYILHLKCFNPILDWPSWPVLAIFKSRGYLERMVKNILSVSRIVKFHLSLSRSNINIKN